MLFVDLKNKDKKNLQHKDSLQRRGMAHFTQMILSLSGWWALFLLAFEVEFVELAGDVW